REAVGCDMADPGAQCLEPAPFVRDGRTLREHGRDQDLKRRHRLRPILDRITSLEDAHRSKEGASVHGLRTAADGKKVLSFRRRTGPSWRCSSAAPAGGD